MREEEPRPIAGVPPLDPMLKETCTVAGDPLADAVTAIEPL